MRRIFFEIDAQQLQDFPGQDRVSVFLSFAAFNSDLHPFGIDGLDGKVDQFTDAKSAGIDGAQDGFVLDIGHTCQDLLDFFFTADYRQGFFLTRAFDKIQLSPST